MKPLTRILVPHDFSEHAARALRFASELVPRGGELLVLHVVVPLVAVVGTPPIGLDAYITPAELAAEAKKQLDRAIAKALPPTHARVESKVVIGDPYQRIMAATRGMDAIVMSTAGRTGIAHLLIGSVAEKVVRHSPIPVITLRAKRAKGATRKARK